MTLLFQAILHLLFVVLMEHVDDNITKEGVFSVEFTNATTHGNVSVSFWEGKQLVKTVVAHCGRDNSVVKSNVAVIARLLSVVSMDDTIISCGGCSSDPIKALFKSPNRKAGVQYPLGLSRVQMEMLMHKPNFSVMRRISMFSILRTVIERLSGLLDERWLQSTQFLKKVCKCCFV